MTESITPMPWTFPSTVNNNVTQQNKWYKWKFLIDIGQPTIKSVLKKHKINGGNQIEMEFLKYLINLNTEKKKNRYKIWYQDNKKWQFKGNCFTEGEREKCIC
jgi:hypothetical protein